MLLPLPVESFSNFSTFELVCDPFNVIVKALNLSSHFGKFETNNLMYVYSSKNTRHNTRETIGEEMKQKYESIS